MGATCITFPLGPYFDSPFYEPQQADFWAAWPPLADGSGWLILIV